MARRKERVRAAEIAAQLTMAAMEHGLAFRREGEAGESEAVTFYREMFQVVLESLGDEEERDDDDR